MMLSEKIKSSNWGDKILANVSQEMKLEFPEMTGLSERNLKYCRRFYEFYSSIGQQTVAQYSTETDTIVFRQQLVAQIPWGHNIRVFFKSKNIEEALFYLQKTKENNWSRDVLSFAN